MTNGDNTASVVEYLREKMIRLASESGTLLDYEVIQVSQKLDLHLVQMQLADRPDHTDTNERLDTDPFWCPPQAVGGNADFRVWGLQTKLKRHLHVVGYKQ